MKTFFKPAFVTAAGSATIVLLWGGIAAAHIDPDPIAIEAGTSATVAFKVEHGCDGSPTTSMKFQIPDGVSDAVAVEKEGWTATVTGDTLEFVGGPLDPEQEDHFDITFTAPAAAGEIRFPVIQTCAVGELAWIEIPDGATEPERPAPTVKITEGPPTSADLTPEPEAEDAPPEGTVVTQGTDETVAPTVTVAPVDDDSSSNTGAIVIVAIGAAIVLIGGGVLLARRSRADPQI